MFVFFHTHNCLFVCICHRHVYICLMTIQLFEYLNIKLLHNIGKRFGTSHVQYQTIIQWNDETLEERTTWYSHLSQKRIVNFQNPTLLDRQL